MRWAVTSSPTGQPAAQRAHHFVRAVGRAAGKDHASAGRRRVAPGLGHARLADQLRAAVRPEAEDATSEIFGKPVHVHGGEPTDRGFGIVAIGSARNVAQRLLGGCDAQMLGLPAHGFQDRPDLLVGGKVAGQRHQQLASLVQPTFVRCLFGGGNAVSQTSRTLGFGTLRGFSLLLFALRRSATTRARCGRLASSSAARMRSASNWVQISSAARATAACRGRVSARLLGESLGHQQLGGGTDATGLSQRALGFLAFGGERFVLRQLDGCLLAGTSILASHVFEAGADAGQLGDQAGQVLRCAGLFRRLGWTRGRS